MGGVRRSKTRMGKFIIVRMNGNDDFDHLSDCAGNENERYYPKRTLSPLS